MKNSSKNFKDLVAKMDQLQESEEGKLKGGVQVLTLHKKLENDSNYLLCGGNGYCPQLPQQPKKQIEKLGK